MVCGVPVVASNMMPVTEIVLNGKNGLLFQGQNVQDAVKKLYRIIDDPKLQRQMSKQAIERVQEHFAIEIVAEQYVNLLKTLISQATKGLEEGSEQHGTNHLS